MITPHAVWYRIRALLRKGAVERDVDNEVAFHLDMETEQLVARGVDRSEARTRAMRRFGDTTRVREECLDERGVRPVQDLAQDLHIGARMLRRSPGLTVVSVVTLAVGIAATTTIFSVVDGVLLKPFPYEDAGRLVTLRAAEPDRGNARRCRPRQLPRLARADAHAGAALGRGPVQHGPSHGRRDDVASHVARVGRILPAARHTGAARAHVPA